MLREGICVCGCWCVSMVERPQGWEGLGERAGERVGGQREGWHLIYGPCPSSVWKSPAWAQVACETRLPQECCGMRECPQCGGGCERRRGREKDQPSCPPLTWLSPRCLTRGQGLQKRQLPWLGEDRGWTLWVSPSIPPRVLLGSSF